MLSRSSLRRPYGAQRITNERIRQITEHERFTVPHDLQYESGELLQAARAYLDVSLQLGSGGELPGPPAGWPWPPESWKPSADPAANLVKAGALIAAELDRLQAVARRADPAEPGRAVVVAGREAADLASCWAFLYGGAMQPSVTDDTEIYLSR